MADTSTIVGQTILIKGNLEGDEDLTVQGRIEGAINLSQTLIVEPSGVVKANVSVNNAVVSGIMVGNLTASDSVEITETGRVVGDIKAPRVIIVEGALFKGNVDMGNLEMPRPAPSTTTTRRPSYIPSPPPRRSEPARPIPARPAPPRPPLDEKKPPIAVPKAVVIPPATKETKKVETPAPAASRLSKKKVVVKKKR